jgi:hypothetical protein
MAASPPPPALAAEVTAWMVGGPPREGDFTTRLATTEEEEEEEEDPVEVEAAALLACVSIAIAFWSTCVTSSLRKGDARRRREEALPFTADEDGEGPTPRLPLRLLGVPMLPEETIALALAVVAAAAAAAAATVAVAVFAATGKAPGLIRSLFLPERGGRPTLTLKGVTDWTAGRATAAAFATADSCSPSSAISGFHSISFSSRRVGMARI